MSQSPLILIGRASELEDLRSLKSKKSANLIVLWGRRRIGKSRLAEEFGKSFPRFYEFQGLGPRPGQTNQDQLDFFSEKLREYFTLPRMKLASWTEAFSVLSGQTNAGSVCILFDEISWMGGKDKDFPAKLKVAWDTQFKTNPKLSLIVCGSVSSWIQKNILVSSDFVGRISLSMNVQELSLPEANQFWSKEGKKVGLREKFIALLLTGCVPKYLEEVVAKESIFEQIKSKCFSKNGFFFQEFERVFSDIFGRKASSSRLILETLLTKKLTAAQIAKAAKRALNGKLTDDLNDLVLSGFVSREQIYRPDGEVTDKVIYRIKDNYMRFYLRLIAPKRRMIEQGRITVSSVEDLSGWDTFVGQQFENLVYLSLFRIYELIKINADKIVSAGPYLQTVNSRNKAGCQVDLLINLKNREYYLCEIKSGDITLAVAKEVQKKIDTIKFPKHASIKPVLICREISGELRTKLEEYFFAVVEFEELIAT